MATEIRPTTHRRDDEDDRQAEPIPIKIIDQFADLANCQIVPYGYCFEEKTMRDVEEV